MVFKYSHRGYFSENIAARGNTAVGQKNERTNPSLSESDGGETIAANVAVINKLTVLSFSFLKRLNSFNKGVICIATKARRQYSFLRIAVFCLLLFLFASSTITMTGASRLLLESIWNRAQIRNFRLACSFKSPGHICR